MNAIIKLAGAALLVGFGLSYFNIMGDVVQTVRSSVASNELSQIDDVIRQHAVMTAPNENARGDSYPRDQQEFEAVLRESFEDRDRDVTLDQFGRKYIYQYLGLGSYRLLSAGPDGQCPTDDDVCLERRGDKRQMSHGSDEIVRAMQDTTRQVGTATGTPGGAGIPGVPVPGGHAAQPQPAQPPPSLYPKTPAQGTGDETWSEELQGLGAQPD
jgi:hypothetical protein